MKRSPQHVQRRRRWTYDSKPASAAALKLAMAALFVFGSVVQPHEVKGMSIGHTQMAPAMSLIVRSSPDSQYVTEVPWEDGEVKRKLSRLLNEDQTGTAAPSVMLADTTVRIRVKGRTYEFAASPNGDLYDLERHVPVRLSPSSTARLRSVVAEARHRHYGELQPWEAVNPMLPKYAKIAITDLETGLRFRGQRRAGHSHADVQPLTKQDSAIMKKIYGDHWSWQRRAVLVEYEGHVWAGSMNGMPHGGDGIPDNDFRGHFCIHFPGSTTHKHHQLDLAHQAMVYKAAGQLPAFLSRLTPKQLAEVWILAVNLHDQALLQAEVAQADKQQANVPLVFDSITIKAKTKATSKLSKLEQPDSLISEVPIKASFSLNGKRMSGTIRLTFARKSPADRWIIEQIDAESDPVRSKSERNGGKSKRSRDSRKIKNS